MHIKCVPFYVRFGVYVAHGACMSIRIIAFSMDEELCKCDNICLVFSHRMKIHCFALDAFGSILFYVIFFFTFSIDLLLIVAQFFFSHPNKPLRAIPTVFVCAQQMEINYNIVNNHSMCKCIFFLLILSLFALLLYPSIFLSLQLFRILCNL